MEHFSPEEKAILMDFFRNAFPNPERVGCPSFVALRIAAAEPEPTEILKHVSSCSECFSEYSHMVEDLKEAATKPLEETCLSPLT